MHIRILPRTATLRDLGSWDSIDGRLPILRPHTCPNSLNADDQCGLPGAYQCSSWSVCPPASGIVVAILLPNDGNPARVGTLDMCGYRNGDICFLSNRHGCQQTYIKSNIGATAYAMLRATFSSRFVARPQSRIRGELVLAKPSSNTHCWPCPGIRPPGKRKYPQLKTKHGPGSGLSCQPRDLGRR